MKKPFVAIVDDDSAFASYLRTFLSLRGYETRSYSRGDELLASMKQGDPPDIVLLDVMMPGMNGLETLRALKAAKPDLQAIMLSGKEQVSTIVEAVQLGAANYVVKPGDPEGLGEIALDGAIEKTRLVSEITELRRQLSDDKDSAFLFWGDSPDMKSIATVIEQVADADITVLIRGESGVGKELVARAIHQRPLASRRPLMDGARDELLADAALAANQHRDVAVGHLLDDRRDGLHVGAVAPEEERAVLVVAQLTPQLGDLRHQARLLDRALDRGVERDLAEAFRIVGLDDVVGRAELHRFDDGRRLLACRRA